MKEQVNHPDHYGGADNPYEAIRVIEAWGLGFNLGNCVKYIARFRGKGSALTDLQKARWYLDREIATVESTAAVLTAAVPTAAVPTPLPYDERRVGTTGVDPQPNSRYATWLTTRGQADWMLAAGQIRDVSIIESNVAVKVSRQHPDGYEICRIRAQVVNPDNKHSRMYLCPRFSPADEGVPIENGYHNEFAWEEK